MQAKNNWNKKYFVRALKKKKLQEDPKPVIVTLKGEPNAKV